MMCAVCETHGNLGRVYYSAATASRHAECKLCNHLARNVILLVLGVLIFAAAAVAIGKRTFHRLPDERQQQAIRAWHVFTPHVKLKILLNFYMIATKVDAVYEVEYPPRVKNLLATFRVGVSVGFGEVNSLLECMGTRGFLSVLTMHILTPVILGALLLVISTYKVLGFQRKNGGPQFNFRNALLETALPPLLQLAFLAYPLVTKVAVRRY